VSGEHDSKTTGTDEHEDGLDLHEAATLLERSTWAAQRQLDFRSPWLSLIAAAAVLIAFGSVWLSVRAQHPYRGPTFAGLAGLYAVVLVRIGTVVYAHRRAAAGVSGRSVHRRRAEGAGLTVALVAVYVLMAALAHAGASHALVYGVYVGTATLIVLGTFGAARAAAHDDWPQLGVSITIVLVAAGSAFAGPRGVWLSDGVGCCILLVGYSAAQAWLLRASESAT
jgi:hypothetical protein